MRRIFSLSLTILVATAAFSQEITMKDAQDNILAQIHDEGSAGSFFLPLGSTPGSFSNKLYNIGGTLYWNGQQIQTGTAAGDNLGNHTATQNLVLGNHWLSYNANGDGLQIMNSAGLVRIDGDPVFWPSITAQNGIYLGRRAGGNHAIKIATYSNNGQEIPKLDFANTDADHDFRLSLESQKFNISAKNTGTVMAIDKSTGNIGIGGVTDPQVPLHITGPGRTWATLPKENGVYLGFRGGVNGRTAAIKLASYGGGPLLDFANNHQDFDMRLRLTESTLEFIQNVHDANIVRFRNQTVPGFTGTGTGAPGLTIRYASASGAANAVFDNEAGGGILFFSNVSEIARVQSNGTFRPRENANPAAGYEADLGRTNLRWGTVWTVSGVQVLSDRRAKSNIRNLGYGLSEVMQLRPVSYSYNNQPNGRKKLGLVAQEVQAVVNEAVTAGKNSEEMMSMNYTELIPVLIKAIQEQQAEIEALKKALNH